MLFGWVVIKRLWDSFVWRNSDTELFFDAVSMFRTKSVTGSATIVPQRPAKQYNITLYSTAQVLSVCWVRNPTVTTVRMS
jgi:hypothetical protein